MRKTGNPASHSRKLGSVRFKPVYFFFAAFTFAHLARCAAAIFLRADADMVRLGFIAWSFALCPSRFLREAHPLASRG